MLDKLMKLKEAKKHGEMRPVEQNAKMSVLKDLIGDASSEMGGGLKSLKKVSVVAPDQESLEAGLDKAKSLAKSDLAPSKERFQNIDEHDPIPGDKNTPFMHNSSHKADDVMERPENEESEMHEAMESPEEESSEHECSPEELEMEPHQLDQKIQSLMKLKEDKLSSSKE